MNNNNEENFGAVTLTMPVKKETVRELFTCAVEGGSNYWCEKIRPLDEADIKKPYYEYMLNGFYVWEEESSDDKPRKKKVTHAMILKGLQIMAEKYPDHHFAHAMDEGRMDADTGDVFLQLCVFGEIVYG